MTGACLTGLLPCSARATDEANPRLIEKSHRERKWTAVEIDPARWQMDLFLSGPAGLLRNFTALEAYLRFKGRRVVVAMNGGMFEADGSPVGWCVAEGKQARPANLDNGQGNFFLKPNGIFAVLDGKAVVKETNVARGDPMLAGSPLVTQSGPLLVADGVIHAGFKADSMNRRIRNAVGVTAKGAVWWAISEDEVSFHESATFFRDELACPDALYLDGQVSRLHAPSSGRKAGASLLGPLLAVTAAL